MSRFIRFRCFSTCIDYALEYLSLHIVCVYVAIDVADIFQLILNLVERVRKSELDTRRVSQWYATKITIP